MTLPELVDVTLREGEQFAHGWLGLEAKLQLATLLDALGVSIIEATNPIVSPKARRDEQALAQLRLRAA